MSLRGCRLCRQPQTSCFDVYVGVTERCLAVVECEERKYLNAVYHVPDLRKTVAEDVGTCFPFSEIARCERKTVIFGAVNCSITLKNGDFLKLQLPRLGGVGGGMPHHKEYREAILARLEAL